MAVLVLAFEGVDTPALDRFSAETPTITRLRERGLTASLESTVPATPSSVWTSLLTGTDPTHHAIGDEYVNCGYPGADRRTSAVEVRRPMLWEYLPSVPTVACGLPMTTPPGPVGSGIVVPGRTAGAPMEAVRPPAVDDQLVSSLPIDPPDPDRPWTLPELEGPHQVPTLLAHRQRVSSSLLEALEWELAVVHVPVADPSLFADGKTAAERVERAALPAYRAADRMVEALLTHTPPGTTIIGCSPTGCRPLEGAVVHLNDLLADAGFLERRPAATPRLPRGVSRLIQTVTGRSTWPETNTVAVDSAYRVAASRAFCPRASAGGVQINRAGREPEGRVVPSSYEPTRQAIIETLRGVTDPAGNRAFEFVCKREHLYDGPSEEALADVLVSTNGTGCTLSARPSPDGTPVRPVQGAVQTGVGTLFTAGPAIDTADGRFEGRPVVTDVPPLVYGALDRPIPRLFTGRTPDPVVHGPVTEESYTTVPPGLCLEGERLEDVLVEHQELDDPDYWK